MLVIWATILSQIIFQIIKILYPRNKHKYLDEHLMNIKIEFTNTSSVLACILVELPSSPH